VREGDHHVVLASPAPAGGASSSSAPVVPAAAPLSATIPSDGPALEIVDVELTPVPPMAFFKIGVRPAASAPPTHHVMKQHTDLEDLHNALIRELRKRRGNLPSLPLSRVPEELASPAFCQEIGEYLSKLALCRDAVDTYSFRNFFQLSEEYRGGPTSPHRPGDSSPLTAGVASSPCGVGGGGGGLRASGTFSGNSSCRLKASDFAALVGSAPPALKAQPSSAPATATAMTGPEHALTMTTGGASPADARARGEGYAIGAGRAHTVRLVDKQAARPGDAQTTRPAEAQATIFSTPPVVAASSAANAAAAQAASTAVNAPGAREFPSSEVRIPPPPTAVAPWGSYQSHDSSAKGESGAWSSDDFASSAEPQTIHANYKSLNASGQHPPLRSKGPRRRMCVVCMAAPQEIAIDPCGHLSMCHNCASAVKFCPVCRGPIEKSLRVYAA